MTIKEFANGWKHFCDCIDFAKSALDAKAIRFMNEMPSAVVKGLTPDADAHKCEIAESQSPPGGSSGGP